MALEYVLFLQREMNKALQELVEAAEGLEEAKQRGDKVARKKYEQQIKEAARQACEVDPAVAPTVAFLWLRACYPGLEDHIREIWSPFLSEESLCDLLLEHASLHTSKYWKIALDFTLRKPYLSKDDTEFYILDNPVRKEWVFKVPYIAPSQWKGALRAAMVQELKRWWERFLNDEKAAHLEEFAERRFRMTLLFGDEKGEEPGSLKGLAKYLDDLGGEEAANLYRQKVKKFFNTKAESPLPHHQGWLHFCPTYFDRIGLEVINPHSRETGAGERPIHFESVPADTKGRFVLLYVPLAEVSEKEMLEDFRAVVLGIRAMFEKYGFGAKTSSGFGRAYVRWRKEEGAEVQPEKKLWNEWKRIWREEEPHE